MWGVHEGGLKSRINNPLLSQGMALNLPGCSARKGGKKSLEFPVGFPLGPLLLMVEGDFKQHFIGLNRNLILLNLILLNI